MTMRSLMHWFSDASRSRYAGPTEAAVLLKDGSLVTIDLRSWADRDKLDLSTYFGHVIRGCRDGLWAGSAPHPLTPDVTLWVGYGEGFQTAEEAAVGLRATVAEAEESEAAVRADPAHHLERELSRHDWYCHMSDDPAVFRGGEAHMVQIQRIASRVAPDVREALWAKYAPAE